MGQLQAEEGAETGCLCRKGGTAVMRRTPARPREALHCPVVLWRANSLCQCLSCSDLMSSVNTDASQDGILLLKAFLVCLNTIK